jgi:hypothetical protein
VANHFRLEHEAASCSFDTRAQGFDDDLEAPVGAVMSGIGLIIRYDECGK